MTGGKRARVPENCASRSTRGPSLDTISILLSCFLASMYPMRARVCVGVCVCICVSLAYTEAYGVDIGVLVSSVLRSRKNGPFYWW